MGKRITALITGRGNNELPNKNILDILGKPILAYPAMAAKNSPLISGWYCSSDDEKILDIAESEGYKRIVRPKEFALPTSQHVDCIMHALDELNSKGELPDIIVVILANNVTVKSEWITDCIKIMYDNMNITAVVPVYSDNDHHPLRAKGINEDGSLCTYIKNMNDNISTNRQSLPPCYFLAHNFWVLNVENMLSNKDGQQPWTFMGDIIYPYVIEESIDIHTERDLLRAKIWIEDNYTDWQDKSISHK